MNLRDQTHLIHILEAISKIQTITQDCDLEKFLDDEVTQLAVTRLLEIIGSETKRLSEEFKIKYNKIPWKQIAGMRDKIAHDYLELDLLTIWQVIIEDLDKLESQIKRISK